MRKTRIVIVNFRTPGLVVDCLHSLKTDIRNAGAEWVDSEAVVDGNLVTARKPDDIPAFNRALIELISTGVKEQKRPAA